MKKIEELLNDILIELKSINNSLNQEESDFGNPEIEDIKEIEDSLNQLCADYLLAVLRENQHNYDVNIFDLPFDSYVEYNNGFCYIVLYLIYDEIIYKFEEASLPGSENSKIKKAVEKIRKAYSLLNDSIPALTAFFIDRNLIKIKDVSDEELYDIYSEIDKEGLKRIE